ncbi:hypothetical protein [Piscinibacter defluvii]|uniref:hypothetical protein n=1 Tax=Piscinibacter defluvii TaxID=1796922 RepID=UPI000FDF4898|nr:hypothetical protein [Piscinibacter defluvii]
MSPARLLSLALALVAAVAGPTCAHAQPTASNASVAGTWLVTVSGESNTRTLIIPEPTAAESGVLTGALYGLSGGNLPPVEARLIKTPSTRQLRIVTQASSLIEAVEQDNGTFKGTFTTKGGSVRDVTISRVLDGKLPQALPKKDLVAMVPLDPSTPSECAAFYGEWVGTWSVGGAGDVRFRVPEVTYAEGKCRIRFSYSSARVAVPDARETAEFTDSSFSYLCNKSTNGTCVFSFSGSDLWVNYKNLSGGTNSAVLKRSAN